jgi:hypothetical protein
MSDKRLKRFNKNFSLYKDTNPYYLTIQGLYINDIIKSISSAKKFIEKIKLTKKNKLYKSSSKYVELLKRKQDIVDVTNLHNNVIDSSTKLRIDNEVLKANDTLGMWIHAKQIIDLQNKITQQKKTAIYMQIVNFYDKDDNLMENEFKPQYLKAYKLLKGTYKKNFWKNQVVFKLTDTNYLWKILNWVKYFQEGNYAVIETIAYKKIDKVKVAFTNQLYQKNITNTCVYDGFLQFFSNEEDRTRKRFYNKLIENKDTYARAYTDETLQDICNLTHSNLIIRDLINNKDRKIYTKTRARYNIEFINTKYDHLDLFVDRTDIKKITSDEYDKIKNTEKFYVESFGKLTTLNNTYQIQDDDFKIKYKEWKEKINYNDLMIDINNDEFQLINNYDFSTHCFFNKLEVDDNLYDELDIEKAYFNYVNIKKNPQYHGVPSGSFINIKCNDDYTNETFIKQLNNNLIGYYQVIIQKINNNHQLYEKIGILENKTYVFTSVQIDTLKDDITFKFVNCSISPSVKIPFTDDMKIKDNGLSYYCKAYGLLMTTSEYIQTTIKPLKCDKKYYSIIQDDNTEMYEYDGLIKINKKNEKEKTGRHIAYYIHSYTKNLIFQQLKQLDINDVFGIKIDSIVIKKNAIIKNILPCFHQDFKKCKIEKLLECQRINKCIEIDGFIDNDTENINDEYGHYRPLFSFTEIKTTFKKSFLPNHEMITSNVIFMSGKGGSGKSYSILNNLLDVCMVSCCWNLTQAKKQEYNTIRPLSINKIIGKTNNKKSEKIIVRNKYIFLDELTMWKEEHINQVVKEYRHKFIFLAGDIDYDGKFYQCNLNNTVVKPYQLNCQFVTYKTNYRFDEQLNQLLDGLRKCNTREKQNEYINIHFKNNIQSIENVIYDDKCIGISDLNDTKNDDELTNYFLSKGTTPQYYIKTSYEFKGQFKGERLDEKPEHNNYECKLFKTIHSFQGLDLKDDEKIIISNKRNFDLNLYYTAFSRARRLDQIILIK